MELTKSQKKQGKRAIEITYQKYVIDCLKTGKEALPPDEWWKDFTKKSTPIRRMIEMKGTITKQVGNISVNCMSSDARELLDELCIQFKKEQGKDVSDVSGYQALYWACRYSGLIGKGERKIGS